MTAILDGSGSLDAIRFQREGTRFINDEEDIKINTSRSIPNNEAE
jgi:hypothetical protein